MQNQPSNAEPALPPEQAAAKAAILAECDRLAQAGITFVAVHFDGAGDEGVNEDIKCYATEDYDLRRERSPRKQFLAPAGTLRDACPLRI